MTAAASPKISSRGAALALVAMSMLAVIAFVIRLHALVDLWAWFAVPLGAPVLRWPQFFAAILLVGLFRPRSFHETPKDAATVDTAIEAISGVVVWIGIYLVMWGVGYALWTWT